MKFRPSHVGQIAATSLLIMMQVGCDRREIEVYPVKKVADQKERAAEPSPRSKGVLVKLPADVPDLWLQVDPAGSPRLASFHVQGTEEGGEPADLGVTSFPGAAGGILANVNRWRREMGQPPVDADELTGTLQVDDQEIHIVDAASDEKRTLGAILPLPGETYFFKLTGPIAVVTEHQPAFYEYLSRVEIEIDAAAEPEIAAVEEPAQERPKLKFETPEGWEEGESSSMRAASFSTAGEDGREADIIVIPLGSSGGAELAIINQWRTSLRLEDASAEQLPGLIEKLEAGGREFKVVNFESEEAMLEKDRKARIIVAYATVGEQTWYFKVVGDSSLVAGLRPTLIEFLESVEFVSPK